MSITNLTPTQLRKAADLAEKIEKLQQELAGLVSTEGKVTPAAAKPGRRKMSASARARIAAAQKKRWAALKTGKSAAPAVKKGRRKMSAEGRARIAAAAKARWAKIRAAKAAKS